SCDTLGVDGRTSAEEIADWYRRLGRLFAELLDENCLAIFLPDESRAYPVNAETEAALRADNPLEALEETRSLPVIQVSDDDPDMIAAVQKARDSWPQFLSAFEARAGQNFSVKAPITRDGNTEFIWLDVTAVEGERIYGKLGNEPANLGALKLGSKVSTPIADLNDWGYVDTEGNMQGLYTVAVVMNAAKKKPS
ncbi:MAG: DUF2314 domain-containing protein, partial [Planctomycetes bacterium]|nr:DUF2314 domain-containing protein [Planctomycetota bacterium]